MLTTIPFSYQLPGKAAQVMPKTKWSGISGQSGIGAGYLWVVKFTLAILIPPTDSHSLIMLSFGTI
jgi:energy-converting hydrogenase Eha subunit G